MKVNFVFHLKINVSVCRKSGGVQVFAFQLATCGWEGMLSTGVGPLYFIKSKVNAAVYLKILEYFVLPSADKLYGDADLLVQAGLGYLLTVLKTTK